MSLLTNKKWNSLSQVREHLEKNSPKEKIVSFDGATLVTDKYTYGLAFGKLSQTKNGK